MFVNWKAKREAYNLKLGNIFANLMTKLPILFSSTNNLGVLSTRVKFEVFVCCLFSCEKLTENSAFNHKGFLVPGLKKKISILIQILKK